MLKLSPRKGNVLMKPYVEPEMKLEFEGTQKMGGGFTARVTDTTKSGLLIASDMEDKSVDKNKTTAEGVIVAIGPEVEGVEVGWRVLFNRHSARPLVFEGEEFLTINGNEIFAVVVRA